jgi:hypothetical protein
METGAKVITMTVVEKEEVEEQEDVSTQVENNIVAEDVKSDVQELADQLIDEEDSSEE